MLGVNTDPLPSQDLIDLFKKYSNKNKKKEDEEKTKTHP